MTYTRQCTKCLARHIAKYPCDYKTPYEWKEVKCYSCHLPALDNGSIDYEQDPETKEWKLIDDRNQ
jgi:hypothetical protein